MLAAATKFLLRLCGVGIGWRKSWRSNPNGECVEVAGTRIGQHVRVRDTQDRKGGTLKFSAATWQAFLQETKDS